MKMTFAPKTEETLLLGSNEKIPLRNNTSSLGQQCYHFHLRNKIKYATVVALSGIGIIVLGYMYMNMTDEKAAELQHDHFGGATATTAETTRTTR